METGLWLSTLVAHTKEFQALPPWIASKVMRGFLGCVLITSYLCWVVTGAVVVCGEGKLGGVGTRVV